MKSKSKLILAAVMLMSLNGCAQSLKSITPSAVTQYQTAPTIVLSGNGFKSNDPVYVGSMKVASTFVNASQIKINMPPNVLNSFGVYQIRVRNSGVLNFTVIQYQPQLTSLTPDTVEAGSSYTLDVYGSQFVPGTWVNFNNVTCPTIFVDSTHLKFSIDKSLLVGLQGGYPVTVYNP